MVRNRKTVYDMRRNAWRGEATWESEQKEGANLGMEGRGKRRRQKP